ncbi:putative Secreted Protein (SKSR gene family) [Cryptosporidium parvum]|uniref:Uncharacterized protein n=1 Tax=Cryptosporidium parvum TaxID=5807 RepID=A0A7S7RI58_CRYPV|nr:putative Secreted Protein (SKSR gene family) [Cryptosporidium parvum]|eukprot:QOY43616.1 hypothetical protein CPATCC_000421 [Cryptosporidium parvum]
MKNKHIFLNILVIATFLLTLIVEGAEFNEKSGSKENIGQIQKETLSQESLALLTLVSNTYERNCLVDIIVKLLFSYSALLLKFSYFFNENVLHEQIKRLRETIFHANLESFFINKYLLIDYKKLEHMYNSCFDYLRYSTINQLNTESLNQQYAFIMNIVENHAEIIKPIRESQALLEYLISCDLDSSLKSMVSILINYVSEFISLVEESIKSYKKKKKRNFKKFFDSRKDFLSKANIDLVVSNQKLQIMMEMKVNFETNKVLLEEYNTFLENPDQNLTEEKASQLKQLYNDYYENNECTEEEILEMESLLSISMELLGLISANMFYFNNQELSENIRLVEEAISNINKKISTRGTENNFDVEDSFRIKKRVMENLDYEKVISLNNLSSKFSNKLSRDVIIKNLKGLYLCLLNILKMLKKEFQLNKCGKYIQELMLLVINTYEKIGKECAASLKSNEKNESLTILPLETIRVIRESTISKCKQIITEQVEKKKEKMKEEKEKQEKLEAEKKIQLEQEKLEYKKRLEKLKERSKSKQKKSYPEVKYEIKKVQECDSIILETQKMIRPTVRNKAERRRRLMEEINRFNEKSIKKELIREAVNRQRLTRKSKKNLSSGERRSKSHSMEMNNAQTKDQITHSIDIGSDSSQNSSNESSGDEETCSSDVKKKKHVKKKDFSKCLLPVIKLVEDSINESNKSHQQSKGEGISEESEGACSSHVTEKRVSKKRLANEKPGDTPLVKSTVELFGESFVFETRKVGQRGAMEGTAKSSSLRETSNSPSSVSQIESITDKQLFGKQSNSEARKSRSGAKSSKLFVRRALSEPPLRNKPSSNLKTRAKSIPRTRSRSRSRSRKRRKSTSRSKLHLKSEIYSDDATSEMISKLIQLEERMSYSVDDSPGYKSKFIPMFSKSKVAEEAQSVDIFSFFNIVNLDFLEITEVSTIEEIEAAIEFCSEEITRIHTEILPLLTGCDLIQMKNFQKDLISRLIRLLIMFNNKKNE